VVVGGHGGRLDHLLGNVLLLTADRWAGVDIEARLGAARAHVVRRRLTVTGAPGELVTLLAVGGPATGITTTGLRYPLDDEDLEPASSRGVSNVLVDATATVAVRAGTLLVVRPGGQS
jgi:thiamine pyrophosphokinase